MGRWVVAGLLAFSCAAGLGSDCNNGSDGSEQDVADTTVQPDVGDVTPPTWPEGSRLLAVNIGANHVLLQWTAASDDDRVARYRVEKDGVPLKDTHSTTCLAARLTTDTEFVFQVQASDAVGNWTTDGPTLTVRTMVAPNMPGPVAVP